MMKVLALLCLFVVANAVKTKEFRLIGPKGTIFYKGVLNNEVPLTDVDDDKDILTINQKNPNGFLVEGDMLRSPESRSSIINSNYFWESATVPIRFSPALGLLAISGIEDARVEYEMRTCISLPDRTNEQNYLYFEPLSGCWSYVGMMGGSQTVSIGSGCESMSTVIHEIMHAIGIYHQQSRTDRDGYIKIATENIDADKVYNFDKYGYNTVDERRVAYDYDSVMHYGETAFSNNGQKTILTKDPQFQNNIGQRRTFSEGDVVTIDRMYSCADTLRISYSCNFEDSTICGYVQDTQDNMDWMHYAIGETDGSGISSALPQTDATFGKEETGGYMVVDTSSGGALGQTARLQSMRLKTNNTEQCLQFKYYMDLEAGSSSSINVLLADIDLLNGDVISTKSLLKISGDYEQYWNFQRLTIQAPSRYKLIFEATTSGLNGEVLAIDDVSILDKPCDTGYFEVHDYSEMLKSIPKGGGFYGPLLYTDEGYAYQLLIYPNGASNSADGYMAVYFMLVKGTQDDSLQWPFHDRVVRIALVDQDPDQLVRMDHHYSYITSSTGGSAWEKPTSVNSGWGWSNFMRVEEIQKSRNFLKNDAVTISINVRNMIAYQREHAAAFAEPHPAEPIIKSPRFHHHEDDHHEINIDIDVHPRPEPEPEQPEAKEETVTPALVGGVAFACAVAVFMLMSIVIVCINQTHKQAMTAIAIANHSARTNDCETNRHSNMGYQQEKI